MEAVLDGTGVLREAYVASHQGREEPIFLSDTVFASYVEDLSAVEEPLVVFEGGGKIRAPRVGEDDRRFWEERVALTEKGREVLGGGEDRIRLNGIDRWLGGAHLVARPGGEGVWRWDGSDKELKRPA